MCSKACRAGLRFALLAFQASDLIIILYQVCFVNNFFLQISNLFFFEFQFYSCCTALFQRRMLYYHFDMSFSTPFFIFFISILFCASLMFCLIFFFFNHLIFLKPFFPIHYSSQYTALWIFSLFLSITVTSARRNSP